MSMQVVCMHGEVDLLESSYGKTCQLCGPNNLWFRMVMSGGRGDVDWFEMLQWMSRLYPFVFVLFYKRWTVGFDLNWWFWVEMGKKHPPNDWGWSGGDRLVLQIACVLSMFEIKLTDKLKGAFTCCCPPPPTYPLLLWTDWIFVNVCYIRW